MILDEMFCEAWPSLQENLFDCLEDACCCWAEKCCMKVLCQFWFSYFGHNVICHNFWWLYLQGNFPHSSFLVSGAFYSFLSIFWDDISILSIVMVHPSSYITLNDISWALFVYEKMWICLACLLSPGIWSVAICDESILIPSESLAVMSFENNTGAIFWWLVFIGVYSHLILQLLACFW